MMADHVLKYILFLLVLKWETNGFQPYLDENLKLTKASRVCELHFHASEIETQTSAYDEKTGQKITITLNRTRLKKDAVPSVFPGCPSYLTSQHHCREGPREKRIRLQNEQLQHAIQESLRCREQEEEKYLFSKYSEFLKCLKSQEISTFWTVVEKNSNTLFLSIDLKGPPYIKYSVIV